MERKPPKVRIRLVRPHQERTEGAAQSEPPQEIVGIELGYRILVSEQAEVWTLHGTFRDGTSTREEIGEISLVLIPGEEEPATAVTGFIAPATPLVLSANQPAVEEQLHNILTRLGYDREGYYLSLGVGGNFLYAERFRRE